MGDPCKALGTRSLREEFEIGGRGLADSRTGSESIWRQRGHNSKEHGGHQMMQGSSKRKLSSIGREEKNKKARK
jgi:hypothetical protein